MALGNAGHGLAKRRSDRSKMSASQSDYVAAGGRADSAADGDLAGVSSGRPAAFRRYVNSCLSLSPALHFVIENAGRLATGAADTSRGVDACQLRGLPS